MKVRGTALAGQNRLRRRHEVACCRSRTLSSASAASHGFPRASVAACRRMATNPLDARRGEGPDGSQDHQRKPRGWRAALVRVLRRLVLRCCCSFRWARGKGIRARCPPHAAGLRVKPEHVEPPPPPPTTLAAAVANHSRRRRRRPLSPPPPCTLQQPKGMRAAGPAAAERSQSRHRLPPPPVSPLSSLPLPSPPPPASPRRHCCPMKVDPTPATSPTARLSYPITRKYK